MSARPAGVRTSGGFVLVGVVMMVLALTILGLSLFGLSSFEAQFMNRTLDEKQALEYAIGGLDRARFALTIPPDTLGQVRRNLPLANDYLLHARASQVRTGITPDSSGPIVWGGNHITIESTAEYRGVRRTVSASYSSTGATNYYKRLMSAGDINISLQTPPPLIISLCGTVTLGSSATPDSVWENQATSSWTTCTQSPGVYYGVNRRFVPTPSIDLFYGSHVWTPKAYNATAYSFSVPAGSIGYFETDNPGFFSSYHLSALTINVSGRVVWKLPHGIRADNIIQINGDPNTSSLVIVAHDGSILGFPGAFWCFGGLRSDIPLILVTDGHVKIEHNNALSGESRAENLSIFASNVMLSGPALDLIINPGGSRMHLRYSSSRMDPLIDELMAANALPNSVSASPLTLVPGSWRVLK